MEKANNVINFYVNCNKLKDIIRTGWKLWDVNRERCESIAEHIYGVQMLALAMWSEYKYDIDIQKTIMMLAVHELEEIIIGDRTFFDTSREEQKKLGHQTIKKVLSDLNQKECIEDLILEFDKQESPEAKFAYFCDKLECDIQCKLYDEEMHIDIKKHPELISNKKIKDLENIKMSWSEIWLTHSQKRYNYDNNFMEVSNYIIENNILDKKEN